MNHPQNQDPNQPYSSTYPPVDPWAQQPVHQPAAPPQLPKKNNTAVIITGIIVGAVVLLCVGCFGFVAVGSDTEPGSAADKPAATETTESAEEETEDSDTLPVPDTYKKLTERDWLLIAKAPDAHIGEGVVIHGVVTQFDAATGADAFRGDCGGKQRFPEYGFVDYQTNTVLSGADLGDLVENDLFTAKVTVAGSFDYDTQIGGSTTAPLLRVDSIKITGSTE